MTERETIIYDILVEFEIATEEEIHLVWCIMNEDWEETLNAIIYVRTGCHDIEEVIERELGGLFEKEYATELLKRLEDIA